MKTLFLPTIFIACYSVTVSAATCESFRSLKATKTLCWLEPQKTWVSEACLKHSTCDALTYLKEKRGTFKKDYFRDAKDNEFIFAIFKDKSMVEVVE